MSRSQSPLTGNLFASPARASNGRRGRAPQSLATRTANLKAGEVLDVSGRGQGKSARKIKSPTNPSRVRSRFGFPQLGGAPVVANNARDYGMAVAELGGDARRAEADWERVALEQQGRFQFNKSKEAKREYSRQYRARQKGQAPARALSPARSPARALSPRASSAVASPRTYAGLAGM